MIAVPEELGRLRGEARKLRQENATLRLAHDAQTHGRIALEKKVATQAHRIKGLEDENNDLKKEVAELKSRLGLSVDHVKKLAGMLFKSSVRPRNEPDRKRGAQNGHRGHGRQKPLHVDHEVRVYLIECPDCNGTLSRTHSSDSRTVEDVPEAQTIVTHYEIERQWCTHCHREVRGVPRGTIPGFRIGLTLLVRILFLKYRLRVPLAKIAESLKEEHDLSITEGGLQHILAAFRTQFSTEYQHILEEIRSAPVKHADETGWRILGMNEWAWFFGTARTALYTIEETRGKGVPERIFGHDPTGLLVRDDYAAYEKLPMEQQSCWAHLLRTSHEHAEKETASEEMHALHHELTELFCALKEANERSFDIHERRTVHTSFQKKIATIINRVYSSADAGAVQTRIKNQNTNLISALLHEHAPLTNNHAERMIRPLVVTRKISGGSRSDTGAAVHAVNMSVMQTLSLRGVRFFDGVRTLIYGGNKRYAGKF